MNLSYTFFLILFLKSSLLLLFFTYQLYGTLSLYNPSVSISLEEIGQILILSTLPIPVHPLPVVHLLMPTLVMPSSHFSPLSVRSCWQTLPSQLKVGLILSYKSVCVCVFVSKCRPVQTCQWDQLRQSSYCIPFAEGKYLELRCPDVILKLEILEYKHVLEKSQL